jgi:hypothetical protein
MALVGTTESLALLAAFIMGVLFMLAASMGRDDGSKQGSGDEGKPLIGPPAGWNS